MRTADLTKEQHSLILRISHGSLYIQHSWATFVCWPPATRCACTQPALQLSRPA
jgi:hypothetical protein